MKKSIFILVGVTFCLLLAGFGALSIFSPSIAQNKYVNQWEYAAITFTNIPYYSENQATITGTANVCFLQMDGCRNEEIKAEVIYSKFLQDFRLENSNNSKNLAYSRARELAYTKAVAKLGLEGWEIIAQPSIGFDTYIPNNQGTFTIGTTSKEAQPDIYFKRLIQ